MGTRRGENPGELEKFLLLRIDSQHRAQRVLVVVRKTGHDLFIEEARFRRAIEAGIAAADLGGFATAENRDRVHCHVFTFTATSNARFVNEMEWIIGKRIKHRRPGRPKCER